MPPRNEFRNLFAQDFALFRIADRSIHFVDRSILGFFVPLDHAESIEVGTLAGGPRSKPWKFVCLKQTPRREDGRKHWREFEASGMTLKTYLCVGLTR